MFRVAGFQVCPRPREHGEIHGFQNPGRVQPATGKKVRERLKVVNRTRIRREIPNLANIVSCLGVEIPVFGDELKVTDVSIR